MNFSTRYDVGDDVFMVADNAVVKTSIVSIHVQYSGTPDSCNYYYQVNYESLIIPQKDLFRTTDELAKHLFSEFN